MCNLEPGRWQSARVTSASAAARLPFGDDTPARPAGLRALPPAPGPIAHARLRSTRLRRRVPVPTCGSGTRTARSRRRRCGGGVRGPENLTGTFAMGARMQASIPSRRAEAAAMRTRFDCTAPVTSTVSAPRASASPKWNSIWRTLLPSNARPVQSSRLIQRSMPSAPPRFGAGSSGVGVWPSRARGKRGDAGKGTGHDGNRHVRWLLRGSVLACAQTGALAGRPMQADFAARGDNAASRY